MDALGLLFIIFIYVFIFVVAPLLLKRRATSGVLKNDNWQYSYAYRIGDNVFSSARGHGIEIVLPKVLPEIFIDSHADRRHGTAVNYIKNGQKLVLEGDFNTHFQVYVARGAEQLALSILTPDVMAVLVDSSSAYDVRIVGRSLQLFSDKRIYKDQAAQTRITAAAHTLLFELDHRLRSWQDQASNLQLLKTQADERMFRIGHSYVRLGTFVATLVTAFFGLCFVLFGLAVRNMPDDRGFSTAMISLGLFFFPCIWLLLVVLNRTSAFKR